MLKAELKNSYWFVFYISSFLLRRIAEILCVLFRPDYIISASIEDFELKLSTQANFDTLISNLRLYFQYDIFKTS